MLPPVMVCQIWYFSVIIKKLAPDLIVTLYRVVNYRPPPTPSQNIQIYYFAVFLHVWAVAFRP